MDVRGFNFMTMEVMNWEEVVEGSAELETDGGSDRARAASVVEKTLTGTVFDDMLEPPVGKTRFFVVDPTDSVPPGAPPAWTGVDISESTSGDSLAFTAPPDASFSAGVECQTQSGGRQKRPAQRPSRPRVRAPKGDPTKKHKCPIAGCNYSAKGTGHLYRHMLTHNGRKDHKVSSPVACRLAHAAGRPPLRSRRRMLNCL